MSHVFTTVASAGPAETRALDPYVEGLRAWRESVPTDSDGLPDRPLVIEGRSIEVEPEDWIEIDRHLSGAEADPVTCAHLTAYGIALMVKCVTDLEAHAGQKSEVASDEFANQAELGLDAGLGRTLCRGLQERLDDLIRQGEMERTRALTGFLHRLRHSLEDVQRALGVTRAIPPAPMAPEIGPERVAPPARRTDKGRAKTKPVTDAARRLPQAAAKQSWGRTLVLAGLVVLALFVQEFVVQPPRVALEPDGSLMAVVAEIPGVHAIDARWPSAFVTVEDSVWMELEAASREAWTQKATERLLGEGFSGALFSLDDGTPLARWILADGVRLIEPVTKSVPPNSR